MDRRTSLGLIVMAGGAVTASVAAIPALITALSPGLGRRGERWVPLGRLDRFPVGEVREAVAEVPREDWSVALRHKGVYVWRPSADEVVVFSRSCTDLSCPVTHDPGSGCYFCPCHGGIFSPSGEPMAGPPKVPLYRYANRVEGGVLQIDLDSVPPMA